MDGWMVWGLFNRISVISRRWKGEYEGLCNEAPPAAFQPGTLWSEVGSANHLATQDTSKVNERPHDKTNKMACVPKEDSDQPSWISLLSLHEENLGS